MSNAQQSERPAPALARPRPASQRGLTMVEVMVTLAISAVLVGVAAPSLADLMHADRVRSASLELWGLLTEARAEAVKRNAPVLVCPSNDGASCLPSPTANSWSGIKIACYDVDGNGQCDASAAGSPNPIRVRNAPDRSVQLYGPTSVVRFNGPGTAAHGVTFTLTAGSGGSKSSTIVVTATGSVRSE
jgi:type IV fimbrial biogenesis protein FimT